MSTNPPDEQRLYQQRHRIKKQHYGVCAENGCQTPTDRYRCGPCRDRHTRWELLRLRRRLRGC